MSVALDKLVVENKELRKEIREMQKKKWKIGGSILGRLGRSRRI